MTVNLGTKNIIFFGYQNDTLILTSQSESLMTF